ncbi:MAG: ABC transporter ATP-binding protein [Deltaproteobacteria bacterium]|nr:ABC transporter ATP-binding protein [Deltaproteobacteria bacterium]
MKTTEVVLQASALGKSFSRKGKAPVIALDALSLRVKAGAVTGLVGPDGAGKTTLLRLAAGLLLPDAGSISVLGLDSASQAIEIQSRIGYMPQQFGLYQDLSVQENLELYADLQAVPLSLRPSRFAELLQMTGLGDFQKRRAGALSGGMKQKLGLACSLIKKPRMLLLDEPTVGVDPVSRRDLWQIVYKMVADEGIGVLMATSYLDEADRCAEVVVLYEGRKLAEGTPAEFRDKLKGRVFTLTPPAGGPPPRLLQTHLAGQPGIIDVMIRSGRVRCVVEAELAARLKSGHSELFPAAAYDKIELSEPSFEDAFMALVPKADLRPKNAASLSPEPDPVPGAVSRRDEIMVSAHNLTKNFGAFTAVREISFEVGKGEIFGLLGPNGAGKSTTFRMLCGLLKVSGGEVQVAGRDLRRAGSRARAQLGYMAQVFSLYRQLPVRSNLEFYGRAYGLSGARLRQRINWALDEFHLRGREESPAGLLPAGYRQRLAMATALLHEPAILFLDEPTSGADPLARREFWLRISGFAAQGVTVVVTTHFMEEAEYCDRLLIMSRGTELVQGAPAAIRRLAQSPENPEPTVEDAFIVLAEGRLPAAAPTGAQGVES